VPYSAIRKNQWKLIHVIESESYELYNLQDDIGEKNNLIAEKPRVAKELKQELNAWRKKVNAQMPIPNPDYIPELADKFSWDLK